MKPLIIACDCGNIVSITGVVLLANFEIHIIGYCAKCYTLVKWESTLMKLAERCQQIGKPNVPLVPPLQIAGKGLTEEDLKLLKEMHITDENPDHSAD